ARTGDKIIHVPVNGVVVKLIRPRSARSSHAVCSMIVRAVVPLHIIVTNDKPRSCVRIGYKPLKRPIGINKRIVLDEEKAFGPEIARLVPRVIVAIWLSVIVRAIKREATKRAIAHA